MTAIQLLAMLVIAIGAGLAWGLGYALMAGGVGLLILSTAYELAQSRDDDGAV